MDFDEAQGFDSADGDAGNQARGLAAPPLVHQLPCRFGRYRLDERLAVGGMAEVFLATRIADAGFERRVVVKRILPHLAQNPRFVEMFLREAKVVAQLDHPHIVSVYDFGVEEGAYFLAMEYVEGLSLRDIRRRCRHANVPAPIHVVVRAIADAALALDAVHRHCDADGKPLNLVHRDISPDNIVLSAAGTAKLLDFGIAKSDAEDSLTQTGELKGKIPYMAPEQIAGDPLDGRSDLYSLGATLYTIVCGRRPIEAKSDLLALNATMSQRPTAPRALRADIPLPLELMMLRLLEKKKERRPQSGREVHDALLKAVPAATSYDRPAIAKLSALDAPTDGRSVSGPASVAPTREANKAAVSSAETSEAETSEAETSEAETSEAEASESNGTHAHVVDPDLFYDATLNATDDSDVFAPDSPATAGPSRVALAVLVAVVAGLGLVGAIAVTLVAANQASDEKVASAATDEDTNDGTKATLGEQEPEASVPAPPPQPTSDTNATTPPTESKQTNQPAAAPKKPKAKTSAVVAPPSTPPKTRSRRRRSASATTELKLVGPAHIRWVSKGQTLGRGTTSADVRSTPKSVLAIDDKRRGKIVVPVSGGVARFASVPKGSVSVRVLPFAKVYLGKTFLGETPLSPFDLAAGSYQLRFVGESGKETRRIQVRPGALLKVKVDLTK